jgi:hypothetical protein
MYGITAGPYVKDFPFVLYDSSNQVGQGGVHLRRLDNW